ncbi:hypothetical protein TD95_005185 [Thielaviopsis punctulata]|uniref:Uncharacterized protein n=1 Tax=Thielaviopsis punctulata TaxID=72032 RepID=A0A0F4Z7K1_9PEZI|nr:hypothetical protein TD95_005185 [Thielaviopsis punctulata]
MLPSAVLRAVPRSPAVSRATSAAAAEAAAASRAVDAAAQRAIQLAELRDLMARYPTKKEWPPDFSELSPQHRFRFEKKWKRRLGLKAKGVAREKTTRLIQYFGMVGIGMYVLLFGEYEMFGEKYRVLTEAKKQFGTLFGMLDKESRYERRPDAGLPPSKRE